MSPPRQGRAETTDELFARFPLGAAPRLVGEFDPEHVVALAAPISG
jgi:hypothetical protein